MFHAPISWLKRTLLFYLLGVSRDDFMFLQQQLQGKTNNTIYAEIIHALRLKNEITKELKKGKVIVSKSRAGKNDHLLEEVALIPPPKQITCTEKKLHTAIPLTANLDQYLPLQKWNEQDEASWNAIPAQRKNKPHN